MQVEVGSLTPHVASLDDSLCQALEIRIIRQHHSASAFRFPQQPSDGPSSQHTPLSAVSNKNVTVLTGCSLEGHACRWGHSAVQPQSVQLWEGVSVAAGDLVRSQGGDLGSQCLLYLAGTRIASETLLCLLRHLVHHSHCLVAQLCNSIYKFLGRCVCVTPTSRCKAAAVKPKSC